MYIFTYVRRYRLTILMFALCLSVVLLFADQVTLRQQAIAESQRPATAATSQQSAVSVTKDVRKTVLENGLTVLTKEVHTAPVVSVQVWYQIGSRHELPGMNGIAHLLEHMLFRGTKERPIIFDRLFTALGSNSNAFTDDDQTYYQNTVEPNKLKALLELEADRMQNALIDAEQLAIEKGVVISEIQGYENSPEMRLYNAVKRAAMPNSPYKLPVVGTKANVEKFTVEQVRAYYSKYYKPENATLLVVGDFDTKQTLEAITEVFGKVPGVKKAGDRREQGSREEPASPMPEATNGQKTDKQPIVLKEPGSAAMLQVIYPLPNANHPDVPALNVMDYILRKGRSSRLYQSLIEPGLASTVKGFKENFAAGGYYALWETAAPGQELTKIDRVLLQTIANLRDKGVTIEELNRAKAQAKAIIVLGDRDDLVGRSVGNLDITSQAEQLGYSQTTAGDYRYADNYLAALEKVSVADVQRVATNYLAPEKRTVGMFEPTQIAGQPDAGIAETAKTTESFNAQPPVDPAPVTKYLPSIDTNTKSSAIKLPEQFNLANGLHVLLLPDPSTPTVTLSSYIKAGTEFDSNNRAGLASLTADNLISGTKTKNALQLAKALEERGATLAFAADTEGVSVNGYSLKSDLPVLVETWADVLQNATFPNKELELSRQQALTQLKLDLDDPEQVAQRQFQQAVYPKNHPFHTFPTQNSLKAISRQDVVTFYQTHYRPEQTLLTLVGDFDPKAVRALLSKQLNSWKGSGKPPKIAYPPVLSPAKVKQLNPNLPGKTQSFTFMGHAGIERLDPRYYTSLVMNEIANSRLSNEINYRLGLTYSIYSSFQAGRYAGPFWIRIQTDPADAQQAIASTRNILQQIHHQGVTEAEVQTAKVALSSLYPVSLAEPDVLASKILMNAVYELDREELRTFTQKIQSVSLAEVNQVAKQLLQPDTLMVVTAGSGSASTQGKK